MANRPVVEDDEVAGYGSYSDEQKALLIFEALDGMSTGSVSMEEALDKLALDVGAVSEALLVLGGGGGGGAGGEGEGGEDAPQDAPQEALPEEALPEAPQESGAEFPQEAPQGEGEPQLPVALDQDTFVALIVRLVAGAPSGYALDALVHRCGSAVGRHGARHGSSWASFPLDFFYIPTLLPLCAPILLIHQQWHPTPAVLPAGRTCDNASWCRHA